MSARVAIVDYGMGNLFSVKLACDAVGLAAEITGSASEVNEAAAVILPGVGAYADAMATLRARKLDVALKSAAADGKPVLGVCLGMQLLMDRSHEFGSHAGLGLVAGDVVQLPRGMKGPLGLAAKVPEVGWNAVREVRPGAWKGTVLEDLPPASAQYFVHSFVTKPQSEEVVVATTRYGDVEFCSALQRRNVFACQFHPERSGALGLSIYRRFARRVRGEEQ